MFDKGGDRDPYVIIAGLILMIMALYACILQGVMPGSRVLAAVAQELEPTPTVDPLDVPELPENPTQVDIGRVSYFYNCMPCHGDQGQGLTDEWRETWVDDHQNCWGRGCHGGHGGDEGFPLPKRIPAVAGTVNSLEDFTSTTMLYEYLQQTHPPQRPGVLPDADYRALTAFLLAENGRLPNQTEMGPATVNLAAADPNQFLILTLLLIGSVLTFLILLRR